MNNLNQRTKKLLAAIGIIIVLALPSIACGPEICHYDENGNAYACQTPGGDAMGIADRIQRAADSTK